MGRFGLDNFYLQAGVVLLLAGLLAFALPWAVSLPAGTVTLLQWATPYVLAAGVVVYLIGRVKPARNRGGS